MSPLEIFSDLKRANDVYREQLTALGLPGVGNLKFTKFTKLGSWDLAKVAAGNADDYYDLGNAALNGGLGITAANIANYTGKNIFEGSLTTNIYVNQQTAISADYSAYLSVGPVNNLQSFFFKQRQVTAADGANINVMVGGGGVSPSPANTLSIAFIDHFPNVMFNFLRLATGQAGVGASTIIMKYMFNGVQIQW